MRIYVEPGSHTLTNLGDVAMLQVAIRRLRLACPGAAIGVVTDRPDLLAGYCPETYPVPAAGRRAWLRDEAFLTGRVGRVVPPILARPLARAGRRAVAVWPELGRQVLRVWRSSSGSGVRGFLDHLLEADAVVVSGCGAFADTFEVFALSILEVLKLSIRRDVPTVLLGQGIGPLTSVRLRHRAAEVLPHANLISVREGQSSPRILTNLGVPRSKVVVTGDDALELAYDVRQPAIGGAVGLSLRTTSYAGIDEQTGLLVVLIVARQARLWGVPLVPLPVDVADLGFERPPTDLRDVWEAARQQAALSAQEGPTALIRSVSQCRVVVTGTYHAAVFALGQGVPVVALAASAHYRQKFLGLVHHFGEGCRIVEMTRSGWAEKLNDALVVAWGDATLRRQALLEATRKQVEVGRALVPRLQAILGNEGQANRREAVAIGLPRARGI